MRKRLRLGAGEAEHNLIQAPELLSRLTQRLGLKQAHVAPALTEGVQAVILLDDLTRNQDANYHVCAVGTKGTGNGVTARAVNELMNPLGSGVIASVTRIVVSQITSSGVGVEHTLQTRGPSITAFLGGFTAALARTYVATDRYAPRCKAAGGNEGTAFVGPGPVLAYWCMSDYTQYVIDLKDPIDVLPGWCINTHCNDVNANILAHFVWQERPTT